MSIADIIDIYPHWHYIGTKNRLIPWILDKTKHFSFNTVLDMFGGTGIMSHTLLSRKHMVWYNELLPSINKMTEGLLRAMRPIDEDLVDSILHDTLEKPDDTTQINFTAYFTEEECMQLDQILTNLHTLDTSGTDFGILLYALSQAAIIKQGSATFHQGTMNQRNRDDDLSSSWHQPIDELVQTYIEEANHYISNKDTYQFSLTNTSSKPSNNLTVKDLDGIDLVYADPPFVGSDSTFGNYIHNYHMLEYFLNYPKFDPTTRKTETKLVKPKENTKLVKANRQWLQPEFVRDAFKHVAEISVNSILILSYRDDAQLKTTDIGKILAQHFNQVEIHQNRHRDQFQSKSSFNDVLFVATN